MDLKFWKYYLLLSVCLRMFLFGEEPSYTVLQNQENIPILTPSLAQRQTLKIRLSNGLEAYLIEDPEATQAGAVLTVQAGSWNDPDKYPGIAHFLEHMLFLGTEKYPIESDYDHFIRAHDGKSNAYTASDYTLYLFSVCPDAFEEALDRFSFFFKKPLFNPSGVERELRSIDQEFAKNLIQDSFRGYSVTKELANPQHPFHRFSSGNSTTLSKVTQKTLKQWYQDHYSAHLMRLIVYGPQPLETLKSWIVKDFKEIPTTWQQASHPQVSVLAEDMQGKIVYIEPIKNMRTLNLKWELPPSLSFQTSSKPEQQISNLLGHEGKGSLLAILKSEGLADGLSASGFRLGKNHLLFSLDISLTQEGLEKISCVLERCFQAIQILEHQDLPSYIFEELKKIHTIRYQYQSREDVYNYLMKMGERLVYEDLSPFPQSVLIPQIFNQELFHEFLSYLTPQRVHLTIMARDPTMTFNQTEKWVEVPYQTVSLSSEQLAVLNHLQPNPELHLPPPNPFVPQNLSLVNSFPLQQVIQKIPHPHLLVDNEHAKIYFAIDNRFQLPQTMWFFEIKTPLIELNDPAKVVLADLYIKCLEEKLNHYSYPAQIADLSYHISRTANGILLSFSGYRDNAETLFDILLEHLKNCHPSRQAFQNFKESLSRRYQNFSQESPLQQGFEVYQNILHEPYTTHQEHAAAIEQISYEDLSNTIDHLFDQTYVEGLLYGNISEDQTLQIWKKLQTIVSNQVFPSEKRLVERVVVLPAQSGPHVMDLHVKTSAHAAILGVEHPSFSFKTRAAQQILAQAMNSAFYSTLRTKQQTGYMLYSSAEEFDKHLFMFFAVQSTTHDPRDLLARFELFIESFLEDMEKNELTQEHFEQIQQSLLNSLENLPQNLVDTGHLLKALAFNYEGDFDWINKRIQGLKELTYEEFLEISRQFLGKQNKRRLAVLIRGTADKDFHYQSVATPEDMRKLSIFD
jgi:insulysin